MPSLAEAVDRIFPEPRPEDEPMNELKWSVPVASRTAEVLMLHSPKYHHLAVVADGSVVDLDEEFTLTERVEVAFSLGSRSCVLVVHVRPETPSAPGLRDLERFWYELFVDGRDITDDDSLEAQRLTAPPDLPRGAKAIVMCIQMIPAIAVPNMLRPVLTNEPELAGVLIPMFGLAFAVAAAGYRASRHVLQIRGRSAARRLLAVGAVTLSCYIAVFAGLVLLIAAARNPAG